eukprot:m.25044 g.25044  ORF g.25044 m.25044 type:complete len:4584 (+) comp28725_c0_seq1:98-13849(+)
MAAMDDQVFSEDLDDEFHDLPGSPIAAHERVELREVIGLLKTRLAVLTGGKDKSGAWLITFPGQAQGKRSPDVSFDQLKTLLAYLVQVAASSEGHQPVFSALVDARNESWHFCKFIVRGLEHFLTGRLQAAYVLEPTGFWSKRRSNTIFKKEKGQLSFETFLLSSPSKLGRHIEMSQLTEDLGGYLPYDHTHWIETRQNYDQFLIGVQQLFKRMDEKHKDLSSRQFGTSVAEAEEMLVLHREEHADISKMPVHLQIEGQSLLEQIVESGEGQAKRVVVKPPPSLTNIMQRVQNQLEKVKGKRDLLEEVWELRLIQLEQCLQFRDFEHQANQAISWFHGPAETFLSEKMPVGTSKDEAESYMMRHISFEGQAGRYFDQMAKLQVRGETLIEENQFAVTEIRIKLQHIDKVFRVYKKRMAIRGQRLALSAKFHGVAEEVDLKLDDLMSGCDDDVIAYDTEAAEHLLDRFKLGLEEVDDMMDHMQGIGEGLMDLLQGQEASEGSMRDTQRRHFGELYKQTARHFMEVTDRLAEKRVQCGEMVQGKQNKLEQFLQLKSCEQDTDKITDWLSKASDLVHASQTDIGDSEETAQDLQQEHSDFSLKAKATYENGLQLIETAMLLREQCSMPTEPCIERHQHLDTAWSGVVTAVEERKERLEMSTQFFRDDVALNDRLDKIGNELRRQERIQNVQAVEQLMVHYRKVWETARALFQETKRCGEVLLERMQTPEASAEVEAVQALISTRVDVLSVHWKEVEDEWRLKMKRLEHLMGVKDFEQEVQQVLDWIEKEITSTLAARNNVGHSLASSTELLRETEQFQKEASAIHEKVERLTAQGRQEIARGSLCKDQFEAGVVKLDLQWKEFSVRLLHWKSLLTMAVSFFEKADDFNQFLIKGVESFRAVAIESSVEGMERLLDIHGKRTIALGDLTKSVINEGNSLLDRLKHPGKELQLDVVVVNYDPSVGFLTSFLTELQDRSEQLDDMWTARGRALQQALELRKFERSCRMVASSAEEVNSSVEVSVLEVGPSVAALMLLQEQHSKLEVDAKDVVRKMSMMGETAESLVKAGHYAAADIKRSVRGVAPRVRKLAAAVLQRRKVLSRTGEFQKNSKQLILVMDEIQKKLVDAGSFSSKELCATALRDHSGILGEVGKCEKILEAESSSYLQLVSTVPRTDTTKITAFVKKVGEKLTQLKVIWQQKGKRLEFLLEGLQYREKVQETTEWIGKKAWDFFSSKREMGQNLASAQEALQNYEAFEESSKPIHSQVISLYQQADKLLASGQRGADIYKSESDRLISEWQHFLNHLDKSSQVLILYVSFYNAARQFTLLLNDFEAYIEDLNEQVLHHQSTKDTDVQLEECHRQMQKIASQTEARLKSFNETTAQYLTQVSRRWPVLETQPAGAVAAKMSRDLHERQKQLEAIWEMRKGSVEQEAEIQQFQQQTQKLVAWLHARTDAYFQQYGPGLPVDAGQAKERQVQLAKFQQETDENVKQIRHLLAEGERLIHQEHPVQSQYEQLRNGLEQFLRRTTQYKAILEITHTFHHVKEDLLVQLKRLRDSVTSSGVPEDPGEATAEKKSLEERWKKISSYMDRLSALAADIKQHGRQSRQKNPAASLDHLNSQYQSCERLVKERLERLGRSLQSSEYLLAVSKAKAELKRKAEEYFSLPIIVGDSRAVIDEQQRQLDHFDDDTMVSRRRVGELIDEGKRKMASERSGGGSVVSSQLEAMEELEQLVNAQIAERREQLQLCLVFHSHAEEARKWCREATIRFTEAHNRGLSPGSSRSDVRAASEQLHVFFGRRDAVQRGHLKALGELAVQVMADDTTVVVENILLQSKEVMDRFDAINAQLSAREKELRRRTSRTGPGGKVVMESEEESDVVFVSQEMATYEEVDSARRPGPKETSFSSLVAASIGAFGISESDSSLFYEDDSPNEMQSGEERSLRASATARAAVFGSGPEEEEEFDEDETDFGEDAKEMRKALKKIGFVLDELVKSELDYVRKLKIVVKGFLPKMEDVRVPTILEGKKSLIFANIEEIFNFHKVFVNDLELYQNNPQQACMCFIREEKNFWIYFPYCKNKSKSQKVLDEYGGDFFEEIKRQLGLPLPLSSYLLEPIQRMMRYQMLLKELVKYAERARLDCASDLQAAVNAMLRVPKTANDALHLNLLEGFTEEIDEKKLLTQELFLLWASKPGDKLKKKGQELHVFLHEDMVIFCRKEGEGKMEKNGKEGLRYVFKNRLLTSSLGLVENYRQSPNHAPDKSKFALTFGQSKQQFVLQPVGSDTKKPDDVKKLWVDEIRSLLQRQLEAARTLQKQNLGGKTMTLHPLKGRSGEEDKEKESPLARPMSKTFSVTSMALSESGEPVSRHDMEIRTLSTVEQIPETTMKGPTEYIAVRNYEAQTESEVSVQVGQRVDVIDDKSQQGWVLVCTEPTDTAFSMEGFIPADCIQPESTASFSQQRASAIPQWPVSMQKSSTVGSFYGERTPRSSQIQKQSLVRQSGVSSLTRASVVTVRAPSTTTRGSDVSALSSRSLVDEESVVRQDFVAEDESMVSVKRGQMVTVLDASVKDWRLVRVAETEDSEAKEGYIPLSCLMKQQAPQPPVTPTPSQEQAPSPPVRRHSSPILTRTSQGIELPEQFYVAQSDYEAADESQVSLKLGQRVEVIDKSVPGWWTVRTLKEDDNEEGFVPADALGRKIPSVRELSRESSRESKRGSVRSSSRASVESRARSVESRASGESKAEELQTVMEEGVPDVPPPPPLPDYITKPKNGVGKVVEKKKDVEEKVVGEKDKLKLSFQAELSTVLKRKLKTPVVERATLYKSQFLQSDPNHQEVTEEQIEELPTHGVYHCAFADYFPADDTQLPLFKGQKIEIIDSKLSDWWLARIPNPTNGESVEGWVPSNYLQDVESYEKEHGAPQLTAAQSTPEAESGFYRAIADFSAVHEGTVPLISGEIMKVHDKKEGWWLVSAVLEDGSLGPEGWAPAAYLEPEGGGPAATEEEEETDCGYNYRKETALAVEFLKRILGDSVESGSSAEEDERISKSAPPVPPAVTPPISAMPQPVFSSTHTDLMSPVTTMDQEQDALVKRMYVMKELLDTEREYVEYMEYAVKHYYSKMSDSNVPPFLASKKDVIFANMPEILEFHKNTFRGCLDTAGDDAQAIGSCFVDYEEKLQTMYVTYCRNKPKSDVVLQDSSKTFFDEIQSELKDKSNISGYLMKPVWRITKYQLLLKDLVKYTKRAKQDASALETALEECLDIPRKANNALALAMFDETAKFDKSVFGELLLQDSFLVSDKAKSRSAERRQVFLFERFVLLAKIKRDSGTATSQEKVTYQEKTRLNLEQVMLTVNVDNDPCRFMLTTSGKSSNKYFLKAHKPVTRNAWVEEIQNLLTAQLLQIKSAFNRFTRQSSPGLQTSASRTSIDGLESMIPDGSRKAKRTTSLSRSSMKHIQMKENLRWIGADGVDGSASKESKRQAFQKKKEKDGRPKISIEFVKSDQRTLITVGETYVVAEDVVAEELLLSANEHVSVLSGDGKGNYLVESKDGESGWIPAHYLRDENQSEANAKDSPKLVSVCSVVACTKGQTAQLKFDLFANPSASVRWYQESDELPNAGRFQYRTGSVDGVTILEIGNVVRNDAGTYKCVATNDFGLDSNTVVLEVQDVPDPPQRIWVNNVLAKSAQVNWSVPEFDGGSPVLHYTVEKMAVDGHVGWVEVSSCCRDSHKTVFQLDEGASFQFRVFAVNAMGKSAVAKVSDIVTTRRKQSPGKRDRSGSPYKGQIIDIRNETLSGYYEEKEDIASGKYGFFVRCVNRRNGLSYAAKVMKFRPGQLDIGRHEVDMMNGLRHPNIVYLKDAFLTQRTLTIIIEMADGGPLFERIADMSLFTESDACRYVRQIVSACSYLHEFGVVHLDLKPENFLLERRDNDIVKIVDFGKAQRLKAGTDIRIVYGNPEFVAPEVLSYQPVSAATDMWSIGVVTYVMLSGISPFYNGQPQSIYLNIESAAYTFTYDCFDKISTEAKQFIRQLLIADRRFRLTIDACLSSAWLQAGAPKTRLETKELRNFISRRREQAIPYLPNTPRGQIGFESSRRTGSQDASDDETPPGFSVLLQDVRVPIGRTVSFTASVFGYPEPVVRWYKDQAPFSPEDDNPRIKIRSGGDLHSLMVINVERRDAGKYACSAVNSFGSTTTTAELQIDDNPAAPYRPSANQLEATSALICWEAPTSEPHNPVLSYIIERRRTDHDTWEITASGITSCSYIADGLLPGHGYQFRVVALSQTGQSQPSDSTGIVSLEEQTGDASAEIQLRSGNPDDAYDILEEIGRGRYGVVMKCREKSTDRVYAAKFIPMDRKRSEDAWRELEVMQMACHPRLASLHEAFDSSTHLVLISEHVEGGRLFDYLASLETCTEDDVMVYTRQVLEGLDYLHQRNIVYLNLKPETILIGGSRQEIKLIDFGRARILTGWTVVSKAAGSIEFMAPEALSSQPVSGGTDVWSAGAIVFTLLTGSPPFVGSSNAETIERTCRLHYTNQDAFTSISLEAIEFVQQLLFLDQNGRPLACDCTKLPWMKATAAQSSKRQRVIIRTTHLQAFLRQRNAKADQS